MGGVVQRMAGTAADVVEREEAGDAADPGAEAGGFVEVGELFP
jgi:hypothetical protein